MVSLTREEIEKALNNNTSAVKAAKSLGICYESLKKHAKHFDLWVTNQAGKGSAKKRKRSDEELFVISKTKLSNFVVKTRFIELTEYKCCECKIDSWNGLPIILELDHINGNNKDNRFKNLRLLCPNCHSQTETFRGRGKARLRVPNYTTDKYLSVIKTSKSLAEVASKMKITSGSYETIKNVMIRFNLTFD